VLGLSAIGAGLVVAPLAAVAFAVSAGVGRFMHHIPARLPLGGGLLLIGAGSLLRCTITASSGWAVLIPGLIVTGIGVGLASPVLVSATLAAVRAEHAGMASGSVNTFRQLGYALGIAALGTRPRPAEPRLGPCSGLPMRSESAQQLHVASVAQRQHASVEGHDADSSAPGKRQ
jgi:hypothetical protein